MSKTPREEVERYYDKESKIFNYPTYGQVYYIHLPKITMISDLHYQYAGLKQGKLLRMYFNIITQGGRLSTIYILNSDYGVNYSMEDFYRNIHNGMIEIWRELCIKLS